METGRKAHGVAGRQPDDADGPGRRRAARIDGDHRAAGRRHVLVIPRRAPAPVGNDQRALILAQLHVERQLLDGVFAHALLGRRIDLDHGVPVHRGDE